MLLAYFQFLCSLVLLDPSSKTPSLRQICCPYYFSLHPAYRNCQHHTAWDQKTWNSQLSLKLGPRWCFLFPLLQPRSPATPRSSMTIKIPLGFSIPTRLLLCPQVYPLPRQTGQNPGKHPQTCCPGLPSLTASA